MPQDYYPVLLALGVAIALGVVILSLSYFLGRVMGNQTGGKVKGTAVESGVPMLDRSHKRISVAFFLVAIDFIVFDLEAAFLYPWALVMKEGHWPLFWAVMVFIHLILVGYAYVWLKGGLDIGAPKGASKGGGLVVYGTATSPPPPLPSAAPRRKRRAA